MDVSLFLLISFPFCSSLVLAVCGFTAANATATSLARLLMLSCCGLAVVACLAVSIFQLVGQPIEPFVQTVAAGCAGRLNVPVAVS